MKKKIFTILFGNILILGMVTGCSEQSDSTKMEPQEKAKGNCEAQECIQSIEPTMSVDEVNGIIGFDGEKKDDADIYVWQLTDKTKIEVKYKDGLGDITATLDKEKISNDKLKLSICYDIQSSLRKGETFTYEEMVEKFEGIEGYLASKSSTSKMYMWVKDDQTFRATFSDSLDGKCSIVSLQ